MNAEIQIQFPRPGEWEEFTLTPIYQDKGGYRPPAHFTQDEIPADHALAMQAVVAALVELGEDWQAVQVWARLKEFYNPEVDDPMRTLETVELTVEAVHVDTKGRRMFTARSYPEFIVADPAAVAFFKHFTTKYEHE